MHIIKYWNEWQSTGSRKKQTARRINAIAEREYG